MLAYVFWHSPATGADRADYERLLAAFHAALAAEPPPGFAGSSAHAVDGLAWLGGEGYEDWYLVERWEHLGALNEAAVDARHGPAHDAAAGAVGAGSAGVYRLRAGATPLPREGDALWLHKPRGVPYPEFRARIDSHGGAVWERQMVLGPAPEYCLIAPSRPPDDVAASVLRRAVFP
jgi:hypothetical protein